MEQIKKSKEILRDLASTLVVVSPEDANSMLSELRQIAFLTDLLSRHCAFCKSIEEFN